MANSNEAAKILKQLEEGTREIYARYEGLIEQNEKKAREKERAIRAEYAAAANAAAARSRIDLNNTLERMADAGMVRSGETVQASLAANADRNRALAQLDAQKAKDLSELSLGQTQTELDLRLAADEQVAAMRNEAQKAAREQANADREYALAEKEYQLKASAASGSGSGSGGNEALVLSQSPYELLQEIVKQNTSYHRDKGYKAIDRTGIRNAVISLCRDKNLSVRYRYELYLYAKGLGYLPEE